MTVQPNVAELVSALRGVQEDWGLDAISVVKHLSDGPLTLRLYGVGSPVLTIEDAHGSVFSQPAYLA